MYTDDEVYYYETGNYSEDVLDEFVEKLLEETQWIVEE